MLVAATPLANFIGNNPTIVMLALGFLLMIGTTLIADGFGVHVPKGYIYAAMAFSAVVEGLNMLDRRARKQRREAGAKRDQEVGTALLASKRLHAGNSDIVLAFEPDRRLVIGLGHVERPHPAMDFAAVRIEVGACGIK